MRVVSTVIQGAVCALLLAVAALALTAPVSAAGNADDLFLTDLDRTSPHDEEDLSFLDSADFFSVDDDDLFSVHEDGLFGNGGLLVEVDGSSDVALEEVFLVNQGVDIGGTYRVQVDSDWAWSSAGGQSIATGPNVAASVGGTLFLDARPSRNFRAFAKAKADTTWTKDSLESEVKLHELFSDFVIGDRAFFRLGKQTVNWGVGYFFSPADIINIGRIDPEHPEAEREGPAALRLHVPTGRNNLYAYAILEGKAADGHRLALAPKAEIVFGGTELGLGLYYRDERAPRAMATVSTTLGRVSVFGEAVLSKGSDKRFVRKTAVTSTNPLGLTTVTDSSTLYAHVTAGLRYTYSDPDGRYTVTGAGQYYFNGEGYDGHFLKEYGPMLWSMIESGPLSMSDVERIGRHYGALSVRWTNERLRNVDTNGFWLGNLSDGSGLATLSLAYTGWNHVRPAIGITRTYGQAGSEYALMGPSTRLTVGITVGRDI